ncbi:MAG: cell envelope biogenesis protein TolA [Sphingomonas sp.]|jgi:outer membrane biosynthesis protein TonB|uniref:cell envelope biogenesis protein TolA n=1 Tax=Sphingomonas sp. TaxID=28214 RepID=UPI003567E6B5
MDRTEKVGLGVAIVGHVVVFGALSLGFFTGTTPPPPPPPSIDVSLVDKVGLQATAPQAVTPPAQSEAPELGAPEDAPAAPAAESEPDPAPPKPQPKAAPPPKPAPAPPQPKKPVARTPDKAKEPPKREATTAARPAKAEAQAAGSGTRPGKRPSGADLGDIMKGIGTRPTRSTAQVPQAATMSAQAAMDISSKIQQQVQPCANRQVKPGPGAERIRVIIRLKLRRDGSLIGNPEVVGYDGDDDDNRRYLDRVKDNAIATFKGCAPLRDLPQELYDVPRGWSDFKMRYKLPG